MVAHQHYFRIGMEILLQESYAVVNYYPDRELICLHLIRKVGFPEYKRVLQRLIELLKEKRVLRLIIDQRYLEEATIEERAWFVSQWFPRLVSEGGLEFRLGFISAKNLFERMGIEYVVKSLQGQGNYQVKVLESMDEALQWMES